MAGRFPSILESWIDRVGTLYLPFAPAVQQRDHDGEVGPVRPVRHLRIAVGCSTAAIALAALAGCGSSTKNPQATASTTRTPATTSTATTTTTTMPGASTPEGAIHDFLAAGNHAYVGDCSTTSVPADIGKYCSILRKDNGTTRSYLVGPVASEGDIYVVARKAQGWSVVQVTPTPALVP